MDGGYQSYHHDGSQDRLQGCYDQAYLNNYTGEQSDATANGNSNHSLPLSGQKRIFSHSNGADYGVFVKLYVVGIPRTATEQDISAVFGEHGHIKEVVLLKDKRTGQQHEYCFVKYATVEQGEQAISALHGRYTFAGVTVPVQVRYAVGERERLGSFAPHIHKLYVGGLNKQVFKWEIEEIFSPFGTIEDIFIVKDEFRQCRGSAFVQFACRDMAIAAIHALHGTYVMGGCEQPLVVRFADPKKPRTGDSRSATHVCDRSSGNVLPNEMRQLKSSTSGCNTTTISSTGTARTTHAFNLVCEMEDSVECEWSEHVSPDGELYYYNCVTCESRWEKPEEYAVYEEELDNLEEQQQQPQDSKQQTLSSPDQVSEALVLYSEQKAAAMTI